MSAANNTALQVYFQQDWYLQLNLLSKQKAVTEKIPQAVKCCDKATKCR